MALQRDTTYSGRFDAATTEHPQGGFKNRTSATSEDGSYLEKQWLNDWDGFFGSLLSENDITPNDSVDEVGASQYFDGLLRLREVSPLNNDWNGYLVPSHTVPIEFQDTSAGSRSFSANVELAPNIFTTYATTFTFTDDGWQLSGTSPIGAIHKLFTFSADQLSLIDINYVYVYVVDESDNAYFVTYATPGINISKPSSTTLKVELTQTLFSNLGISYVKRFFVTESIGHVVDIGPTELEYRIRGGFITVTDGSLVAKIWRNGFTIISGSASAGGGGSTVSNSLPITIKPFSAILGDSINATHTGTDQSVNIIANSSNTGQTNLVQLKSSYTSNVSCTLTMCCRADI